jgi:nucleoside-diphosphate-sugar epimerase
MRVLVTGAAGFVGRALVAALADADMQVRAAARCPQNVVSAGNVETVSLPDLAGDVDWAPLLHDMDAVVHLAGIAHAGGAIANHDYDRINRAATETLALACARRNIHMIFMSSIRAQSGPSSPHVQTENTRPQPNDAYGCSKLAAEDAIRNIGAAFTILRPVVMYGPGVKGNIATMLRLARMPLPLPLAGCDAKRSLLAVDNLVSAVMHILQRSSTRGETYIVADETPVSLAEMIAHLRRGMHRAPRLLAVPPALFAVSLRLVGRSDVWARIGGALIADSAKLRSTGWHPVVDTPEGLVAMAQAASPRKSGTASRSTP